MKRILRSIALTSFLQFTILITLTIIVPILLLLLELSCGMRCFFEETKNINSIIIMLIILFLSFISLKKFVSFLGMLNFRGSVFLYLLIFLMVITLIVFLEIDYSIYFITISSFMMLVLNIFFSILKRRFTIKNIAYVSEGGFKPIKSDKFINWFKIESPKQFNDLMGNNEIGFVTADLRSNLSNEWEEFFAKCSLAEIPVYHSTKLLEMLSGRVRIDHLYENDLGSLLPSKSYKFFKRCIDITVVLISVPIILPIMIITGVLIAFESCGSVFFVQERVGQGGKIFKMFKFRSMYTGTVTDKTTGDSDSRITRVGRFIRKLRIDELPQFLNVLKGDMSLIGPRAEFYKFAEEYEKEIPFYSYRHIVKPGISGWAQVVQGYNFGIDQTKVKLQYDFYYIKNFSLSLDILIFFKTIFTIFTGFGAR